MRFSLLDTSSSFTLNSCSGEYNQVKSHHYNLNPKSLLNTKIRLYCSAGKVTRHLNFQRQTVYKFNEIEQLSMTIIVE